MPTLVRNFQFDDFYHIYNRGNRRQPIFFDDRDYSYFLLVVSRNAKKHGIKIVAYCLMKNHYHFLIQQKSDDTMSVRKWIGGSAMSYGHYFNTKYEQVGQIFQGRYRSKVIENDDQLYWLTQYIHLNPSEFTNPERYRWSSIQNYVQRRPSVADPSFVLDYLQGRPYRLSVKSDFLIEKKSDLLVGYVD